MNILWIIFVTTEFYLVSANQSDTFDGNCYCAVFRSTDNPKRNDPILVSDPQIPIPHNIAGAGSCLRICNALFIASKGNTEKAICEVLHKDELNFYVTVYFRLCNEEPWTSANLTNKSPICCWKGLNVDCN